MADPGFIKFVQTSRSSGMSDSEIHKILTKNGLGVAEIENVLREADQSEIAVPVPPGQSAPADGLLAKNKIIAGILLLLVVCSVGYVFYSREKQKKEEMRFEIGIQFSCAALRAIKQSPIFQSNPNKTTLGEFAEEADKLYSSMKFDLQMVQRKYDLSDTELDRELEEIKKQINEDPAFKKKLEAKVGVLISQGKCL